MTDFKINGVEKKIQIYRNKWMQHVWQMVRDRKRERERELDRLPRFIMKYQLVGNESDDDPANDLWTVNGTRTGHEGLNTARCMMMMMMMMIIIIILGAWWEPESGASGRLKKIVVIR